MNRTHVLRIAGAAALATGLTVTAIAQTAAFDIKVGLWETTTVTKVDMGGAPPMDTSKMTPQQKAKMDEAMKIYAAPHTDTHRQCVTRDKMAESLFPEAEDGCKDTISTNTKTTLDMTRTCTGDRTETSQVHMEALSRESTKGTIASTTRQNGHTQKINIAFTAKWVAADCGKVQP